MSHHPPHIYLDDTWYIITSSTLSHAPYLATDRAKNAVCEKLMALVVEYHIVLRAWVVLNNHYHLLMKTHLGKDLSRFFGKLHGGTSFQINGWDGTRGRQIWHNYWDTCIRDEIGYWTRFNYIHQNPVKHGYVKNAADWPFSSYHFYLQTEGKEWLDNVWMQYPVLDYLDGDDF